MKTIVCIFSSILFLFLLSGCKRQNEIPIESIYALFFNYSFERVNAVNCNEIEKDVPSMKRITVFNDANDSIGYIADNHGVLDTMLTNSFVLKEIANELKKLKPDSVNYPIDARIACVIKYKNGKEEQLCIGGYFADCIEYCGVNQKQNNKLLYLIKKNIGYYSWMGDQILEYSEELQDNSFKRDSIIGYSGRKF